jgi:cell division protease FtsH
VIREAVYLASRQERDKLSLVDLETAANHVRYGAERHDMQITEEDRQRTAWHEAGHAVARLVLFPSEELDLITVVPNERGALGFAAWRAAESRHSHSAQDYRNLIVVALAGREAELHCPVAKIDSVNTGVSSDYERATALAWDYVTRFGFDENFGVFCTASLPPTVEAALASPIYERVQELLANCLEDCRKLMLKEMPRIEALAKALCSKQTLYGEEAKQIFTAN